MAVEEEEVGGQWKNQQKERQGREKCEPSIRILSPGTIVQVPALCPCLERCLARVLQRSVLHAPEGDEGGVIAVCVCACEAEARTGNVNGATKTSALPHWIGGSGRRRDALQRLLCSMAQRGARGEGRGPWGSSPLAFQKLSFPSFPWTFRAKGRWPNLTSRKRHLWGG